MAAEEPIRFTTQIRPLLSDRCFACHGPDDKGRQANLRLDQRASATQMTSGAAAIVPRRPAQSTLLVRIRSHDPDLVMPPPAAKRKPFSEAEVALISRWIEQGAEYEDHWSLRPLSQPGLPAVQNRGWSRGPIDQFLLANLEFQRISPAPEAERAVLLRRVALDLTGLPPDAEKLDDFLTDDAPDAYDRWVDYLLHSPHHGERWGRHWLDQARYADSNGYSIDGEREMWPYRDWVLQALNRDLPFDQFTLEQLAGDLLPAATKGQRVATGFHRNTLINQEGGSDREQFRVESVIDRVNTTGAVWLGLTVGCAQCHTHKFDPLAHREYYQLLAFFNSTEDANDRGPVVSVSRGELFGIPVPPPTEPSAFPPAELAKAREDWERRERERLEKLLGTGPAELVEWMTAEPLQAQAASKVEISRLADHSLLAPASVAAKDSYHVTLQTSLDRIAAVRLRVLTHDSLPQRGPGRASNGNFVLSEFQLRRMEKSLPWRHAYADHEQPKYPVLQAIDGDASTGWAINVRPGSTAKLNADHEAVFVLREPVAFAAASSSRETSKPASNLIDVQLSHEVNDGYQIGRFAIDFTAQPPRPPRGPDDELLAALRIETKQRTDEQRKLVDAAFGKQAAASQKSASKAVPGVGNVMVMRELAQPRPTYLLTRGDFTRPDRELGVIAADVPRAIAPALPSDSSPRNRLTLARWLIDARNPLTPRVTVNRVWMRYFGRGIVETEEDFGMQGTPPTHPELLDWLATEFQQGGWSFKQLHRLIATSAVYRQSSRARPELAERDPRNLWLARQERLRLEGEVVRDAALSASGLLDRSLGGPSVRPPQPEGVYAFTQTSKNWNTSSGGDRYRRGLYTFFYRSSPYPLLTTFDAPDFQTVCTRRVRSNTPLQSLTLANDPAFLEIARGLAQRVRADLPDINAVPIEDVTNRHLSAAIGRMFIWTQSRPPSERERQLLAQYVERQQVAFTADLSAARALIGENPPADAQKLSIAGGAATSPAQARQLAETAALIAVARVLFNTDSFITRE